VEDLSDPYSLLERAYSYPMYSTTIVLVLNMLCYRIAIIQFP
jgi:hypothetical protein